MKSIGARVVEIVRAGMRARAVPENVEPMQRYLKTSMPFYGLKRAARTEVEKELRPVLNPKTITQEEVRLLE